MTDPDRDFNWLETHPESRATRLRPREHYRIEGRRGRWRIWHVEGAREVFRATERVEAEKEFSRLTGEAWG